jgi:rubrerythrin
MAEAKPEHCPVCGAPADQMEPYQNTKIKGTKTLKNLQEGFAGESKANIRDLAFAFKADQEGFPAIGGLFRAVAQSEAIHAFRHLQLLGVIADTQENLQAAFERENYAKDAYPEFIKDANEEGNTAVATLFGYHRDVEKGHAKLYEKALDRIMDPKGAEYYVCNVCGYVAVGSAPDECPICGAKKEAFKLVV